MPKTDALARVRTENAALKHELSALRADHERLTSHLTTLQAQVEELTAALAAAQARIKELEAKKTPPPAFAKPNEPSGRSRLARRGAPRTDPCSLLEDAAMRSVEHRLQRGRPVPGPLQRGRSWPSRLKVVDLPPPSPAVEVTEHEVFRAGCSLAMPGARLGWTWRGRYWARGASG